MVPYIFYLLEIHLWGYIICFCLLHLFLFSKQVVQLSMVWHNSATVGLAMAHPYYIPFIFYYNNFLFCFFKPFSCMFNHWDGAQIYSCQSPRITTRVTPHSLLILPPLFRQIFGISDAKREDDHNLRIVLLSCRAITVCLCLWCVCVFVCCVKSMQSRQLIMTIYPKICAESCMLYKNI